MNIVVGNANVTKLIQSNMLAREIGEALFPALLYRGIAYREPWEGGVGQTMDFLMPGLFEPDTTPRVPGVARPKLQQDYERYQMMVQPYGRDTQVHMPTNYVAAVSTYLEKMKALGLHAAQSLNRLPRDELFRCYQWGHAIVDQVVGAAVRVSTLNGFRITRDPNTASPIPVSNVNPIQVNVNGALIAQTIQAAVPDDPLYPDGPGTLTFSAAPAIVAGDRLDGLDAVPIIRPNGVASVDAINAGDILNMKMIGDAITSLREDSIMGCGDGYYHVHFEPQGENQLFDDNRLQRQIEGLGLADDPYLTFSIGRARGCTFFSNNESPSVSSLSNVVATRPNGAPLARGSGEIGGEITNASGVRIMKTIVVGASALVEKYVNEMAFMTEAGVSGKIGGMALQNGRVDIDLSGIRFVTKSPTDIYNEFIDAGWSFTGAWACPTNFLTGRSGARYKRARVIESAYE